MSETIFVGRQPILDVQRRVVAYELLYRDAARAQEAVFDAACQAATRVIANTFSSMGADAVLGRCRGFVNVTEDLLHDDLVRALPPDRIVIELLETVKASAEVIEACKDLKAHGFTLAVDDWVERDGRGALLPLVDVVKVDLPEVGTKGVARLVRSLRRANPNLQILAEKVETQEEFEICRKAGFDLFQGYFFARPVVMEGAALDPARSTLMSVLAKIEEDAESGEIAQQIKTQVPLSVNLLRLVNSAASGRVQSIEKVEDAIIHIGRSQLRRWMTILLYAGGDEDGVQSPLLQTAAYRGRMMELAAGLASDGEPSKDLTERAFLTGMLSLVDVLLARPLPELLDEMGVALEIREALVDRSGLLGGLVDMIEDVEASRFEAMAARSRELGITMDDMQLAEAQSHAFVQDLVSRR